MRRIRKLIAAVVMLGFAASPSWAQSDFSPGATLEQLRRAYGAMERNDYEAALEHFREATQRANTEELRFQSFLGLGSAASILARFDEARAAYETALEIKPDNPDALYSLGLVAKDQGSLEEAAVLFADAAVRDPESGAALTQLGIVYENQDRHEQAADVCSRAYAISSEDLEALMCFAVARYHLESYDEAARSFEVVLDRDSSNARARYGLGLCRLYNNDRDGAIQDYVKLKELDPQLAKDLYERIFPGQ